MEHHSLLLVIICVAAGSVGGREANVLHSGCRRSNTNFLNCKSSGITTLGERIFVDQDPENVTSSPHFIIYKRTIEHIDLSYNSMSTLHLNAFFKFTSLETLNMDNNIIYRVAIMGNKNQQENEPFLNSLHTLVLSHNRLMAIPKGLGALKSLRSLSLSGNRIAQVRRDDFANCTELHNVDLGENKINNIHSEAFRDLRSLQVLKLHSNALVSLSPLVFLFSHVLGANIDLSDNAWDCDCSLQPFKQFISLISVGGKRPWNVTCSTPLHLAGQHLLSTENIEGPCQTPKDNYVHARSIIIAMGKETSLDCETSKQSGNNIFWWTPRGLISKEKKDSKYYLGIENSLILKQLDYADEGLFFCLKNSVRIVYQVSIQTNSSKTLRRNPRDLQLRTTQALAQNFPLALSLSIIFTFLFAFCLGVFLRPYLERLWIKQCKSKQAEKHKSGETYDNEGFEDSTSRQEQGIESTVISIPQRTTQNDSSSDSDESTFKQSGKPRLKAENNTKKRKDCVVEIEIQAGKAVQESGASSNVSSGDVHKSKRVTWAGDDDLNFIVNLSDVMSLLKPIHFIIPAHDQLPTNNMGNKEFDSESNASSSSDEGSSFSLGSEFYDSTADEDSILHTKVLNKEQVSTDTEDLTINLKNIITLLKPIHITCPELPVPSIRSKFLSLDLYTDPYNRTADDDSNPHYNLQTTIRSEDQTASIEDQRLLKYTSSDEGSSYSYDSDYEFSDEEKTIGSKVTKPKYGPNTSNENNPTLNLKHIISLIKPIHFIVPECTMTKIVTVNKHLSPLGVSRYPESKTENLEDSVSTNQPESSLHNKSAAYYVDTSDESSSSDNESIISANSEAYFSAEDTLTGSNLLTSHPSLENNDICIPTVNFKLAVSSLKPINIIFPDDRTTPKQLLPMTVSSGNMIENVSCSSNSPKKAEDTQIVYDSYRSYESSDESTVSEHDSSDEDLIKISVLPNTDPPKWTSNENVYPTVNIRQVMSSIKPIKIKVPGSTSHVDIFSPIIDIDLPAQRLYESSSSAESSNESADSDHGSSDKEERRQPNVLKPTPIKHENNINIYSSVNIRQLISLIKPIQFTVLDLNDYSEPVLPENIKYSTHIKTKVPQKSSDSSSSDETLTDSEAEDSNDDVITRSTIDKPVSTEWKDTEKVYPTVNLKQLLSSFRPMHVIIPDRNINIKAPQKLSDSSSSDETLTDSEAEVSDEDVTTRSTIDKPVSTEWKDTKKVYPTVNLKQLLSSFRPMHIIIPDTNININAPQKLSESSSSDETLTDSEAEDSVEDVSTRSTIAKPVSTEWGGTENVYPTVNLKQLLSSFRPFYINIPDSNANIKVPQKLIISSSSDETLTDSEAEGSDEGMATKSTIVEPVSTEHGTSSLYKPMPPTLSSTDIFTCTINLKNIISSFKPIHLKVVTLDSERPILCGNKSFDSSSNSSDSENDDNTITQSSLAKPIQTQHEWQEDIYPTVALKQISSSFKPIKIRIPTSDHYIVTSQTNVVNTTQRLQDSSSSDECASDHDDSDEDVIKSSNVLGPISNNRTSNENHTVNLGYIISSFKPITFKIPDSANDINTPEHESNKTDITQKLSVSSSGESDLSDHEYEEAVTSLPLLSKLPSTDNITPTVNLKQAILKPIQIKVADVPTASHVTNPGTNTVNTQKTYDKKSSDESSSCSDSEHEESLKDIIVSTALPRLVEAEQVSTGKTYPTVDLKHVISLVKPVQVYLPSSDHYSDPSVSLKKYTEETTQEQQDHSSSNTNSSDSESDISDETLIHLSKLPAPMVTSSTRSDNANPTVNFKKITSSFKPIYVGLPSSINASTAEHYNNSSSNESSSDSDHQQSADVINISLQKPIALQPIRTEQLSHTLNLRTTISLLKPIKIKIPDSMPTKSPKTNTDDDDKLYFNSSSDESSNDSADSGNDGSYEVAKPICDDNSSVHSNDSSEHEDLNDNIIGIATVTRPAFTELQGNQAISPSLNLKYIMSSLKPIKFHVYDSKPLTNPERDTGVYQEQYKFESDDSSTDSEHEDFDEHVKQSSVLLKPSAMEQTNHEDAFETVNLRYLMSFLKPIKITSQDWDHYSGIPLNLKMDIYLNTQKLYDNNLREESSSDSSASEHEDSDSDIVKGTYLAETTTESKINNNVYPTLNLSHAISLLRPIHIIFPDSNHCLPALSSETKPEISYHKPDDDSSDSDDSALDNSNDYLVNVPYLAETTKSTSDLNVSYTVNLKALIHLLKPIYINVPDLSQYSHTPTTLHPRSEVTFQKSHANAASDESSSDSADLEHDNLKETLIGSTLFKPTSTETTNDNSISPSVNLKNVTSSLKPIIIVSAPKPVVSEVVKILAPKPFSKSTSQYHYFGSQPKSLSHTKKYKPYTFRSPKNTDVVLTSYKEMNKNNIDERDHQLESKDNLVNRGPHNTNWTSQAIHKAVAHEVNLKHTMSIIKPVSIFAPDIKEPELEKPTTQKTWNAGRNDTNYVHSDDRERLHRDQLHGNSYSKVNKDRFVLDTKDEQASSIVDRSSKYGTPTPIILPKKHGIASFTGQQAVTSRNPFQNSRLSKERSGSEVRNINEDIFSKPLTHSNLDRADQIPNIHRNEKVASLVPNVTSSGHAPSTSSRSIVHRELRGSLHQPGNFEASLQRPRNEPPSLTSYDSSLDHERSNQANSMLSLHTQTIRANPIVDTQSLSAIYLESPSKRIHKDETTRNERQNIGVMAVNVNDSLPTLQASVEEAPYDTMDNVTPDNSGIYLAKRIKVFDAFSESVRSGEV